MKVALTTWDNRISPVFDAASTLLVAEIENQEVVARRYESFNPERMTRLLEILSRLQVDMLICGAISNTLSNMIEHGGIRLIPFIGGNVEDVLQLIARGMDIVPAFLMPGCGNRACGKKGLRRVMDSSEFKMATPGSKQERQGPCGQKGDSRDCPSGQGGKDGWRSGQGITCGRGRGEKKK